MLSIGKLTAASVSYYTEQLNHSIGEDVPVLRLGDTGGQVDYYSAHQAPARWMGSGLSSAGVDPASAFTKDAFACLMNHETLDGLSMTRAHARHGSVAGFDHTFSAPKSVSLLYGFGEPAVAQAVREAHLRAVSEAVTYMEERCSQARIGTRYRDEQGRWHVATENVDSKGWVGAAFDHFTSRAHDPQLHTHVVVINRVHTDDGWRALDARRNYLYAKVGGTVYETVLRKELTQRLGVAWGPVVNGIADIEGLSTELLRHFSTRRSEILEAVEAYLAKHGGQPHRRVLQAFTLETRQPKLHPRGEAAVTREMKDYGVDTDVLAHWQRKASNAPQNPTEVVRLVVSAGHDVLKTDPEALRFGAGQIIETLTDRQAVFTHRDLLPQVATWFPDGCDPTEIDQATNLVLRHALESGDALPVETHGTRNGIRLPVSFRLTRAEVAFLGETTSGDDSAVRFRVLPGEARYTSRLQLQREIRVLDAVHQPSAVSVDPGLLTDAMRNRELVSAQSEALRHLARLDGRLVAIVGPGGSGKTHALGAYAEVLQIGGQHVVGVAPTAVAAQRLAASLDHAWTGTIALLTRHLDSHQDQLPTGTVIICDEASMVSTKDLARLVELIEGCDGKLVLSGDPHQLPSIDSGGLFHRIASDGHGVVAELAELNQRQLFDLDRSALVSLRNGEVDRALLTYQEAGRLHLGYDRRTTLADMVDAWWDDVGSAGLDQVRMMATHRAEVELLNQLARTRLTTEGHLSGPELESRNGVFQAGDRIVVRENWYAHSDLRNGQTGTVTRIDPIAGSIVFRRDHDRVEISLTKKYVEASVDYGYAHTVHAAQGQTYQKAHFYLDESITAEHGYTGLSRAREETHVWVAETRGPSGDCIGYQDPITVPRIEILTRQLSRSGLEPPAIDHSALVKTARDHQLVAWRNQLAGELRSSPLAHDPSGQPPAIDAALVEAREVAARLGTGNYRVRQIENLKNELMEKVASRQTWIAEHGDLINRYSEICGEIDRRLQAHTLLNIHNPPDEILEWFGARRGAVSPDGWDAAVETYTRVRFNAGPNVDLLDPANYLTGPLRDLVLAPIEQAAPILRLTG